MVGPNVCTPRYVSPASSGTRSAGMRVSCTGGQPAAPDPPVFVDDGQQPHPCAVMEPLVHQIVGPHMGSSTQAADARTSRH